MWAILTISQGEIDVKAVGGDNHLGGDDFDTNIIKYCLEDFKQKFNIDVLGDEGERSHLSVTFGGSRSARSNYQQ